MLKKTEMMNKNQQIMFSKVFMKPRSENWYLFLAFTMPLVVRAIPEILMGPYVVGFDPVGYYIPNVLTWLKNGINFWEYVAVAPLFYTILMRMASLGIPLTLSLKILPPFLHGLLALAIYLYASRALSWSYRKSLFVALLATLYFVALRISWDMLRNELGLILLFTTLTLLQKDGKRWKHYVLLSTSMIFVVLAHQLVTVIMFAITVITIAHMLVTKKYIEARSLVMASAPATLLFLLIIYANYMASSSFAVVSGFPGRASRGWFSLFGFASYSDMVTNTLGFFMYCCLPLLPFAMMGARRLNNLQIKSWLVWSLVAICSPIISPNAFILGGYRWTLMLAFPMSFYTVEALVRFESNTRRLFVTFVLLALTMGFVITPYDRAFPYYTLFPYYVPSSMLQNTVPLNDCEDTVNALQWLKSNLHDGARLLTHTAFHGWALLVLDVDQIISYGYENPEEVAMEALQDGYNQVYLIWWTDGNGWHGQPKVPSSFKEVYKSGRIAVFIHQCEL